MPTGAPRHDRVAGGPAEAGVQWDDLTEEKIGAIPLLAAGLHSVQGTA
jgi:hypothetical protein